jgi:predicted ATPase
LARIPVNDSMEKLHVFAACTYQKAWQHTSRTSQRATLGLSRLWQQQGMRKQAWQLLANIYGWVTEGFDTADLQEARALLQSLR